MAAQIIEDDLLENPDERSNSDLPEYTEETIDPAMQVTQQEATVEPETQAAPTEDDIPDKYQGKSLQEVVKMHQEAEKLVGRQSSEVGELRRVVDDYISSTIPDESSTQQEQHEEVDFYTDPKSAIQQEIANHPKIKAAEEVTQAFAKQNALQQLKANHPDMESILKDDLFAKWIEGSKIRTKLFVQADQGYDAEAANELFDLWKDRKQVVGQAIEAEKAGRQQAVKNGATGSARGNPDSQSSKKFYRRADIIKLMKNDPDRYMALSDDIMKAYQEGRVKQSILGEIK